MRSHYWYNSTPFSVNEYKQWLPTVVTEVHGHLYRGQGASISHTIRLMGRLAIGTSKSITSHAEESIIILNDDLDPYQYYFMLLNCGMALKKAALTQISKA